MDPPKKNLLKDYIGIYKSDELGNSLKILEKKGKLVAVLSKEIDTVLEPLFSDGFSVPSYEATKALVVFERDMGGNINGLTINVERARNLYFEKIR
jgi:hypothetical protein